MIVPHTYLTTTIPYVKARPHIGFALEVVQADVLARFRRRQATAAAWAIADEANRFINRARPWELARAERDGESGQRLDAVLSIAFEACSALGRELAPFLPDTAARITRQCTPHAGRLPAASPAFRRLGSAR